jgi:hypothetical protein
VAPPVPIPNTEVKRLSADDTGGATPCGKYAIARSLFLYPWSFNPGILRKKAVKPFLLFKNIHAGRLNILYHFGKVNPPADAP